MSVRLYVKVITRSRQSGVIKQNQDHYTVKVTASPEKGRANEEVCRRLADQFSVPRSAVRVVHGYKGRNKIIEIII